MSKQKVSYAILSFLIGITTFYLSLRAHGDPESQFMITIDCMGGIVLIMGYLFGRHKGRNILFKGCVIFPFFALTYNFSASHYYASYLLAPILAFAGFIVLSAAVILLVRYKTELIPPFLEKYRNIVD